MAALWDNLPEGVENVKKTWIKCAGLGLLALAAAWSATSAFAGMGAAPQRVETKKSSFRYEPSCSVEEAEFVLREYDGCIGVFSPRSGDGPISVTDIELRSLREADREILSSGIAVADREELLSLLEDLGS